MTVLKWIGKSFIFGAGGLAIGHHFQFMQSQYEINILKDQISTLQKEIIWTHDNCESKLKEVEKF